MIRRSVDNFGFWAAEKKKRRKKVHDKSTILNPTKSQQINLAMAKGKGKRSSRADTAIPDGGVAVNDSNAGTEAAPQIEESAFAGLRQKIEQRLKDQNNAKQQKSKNKSKGDSKDTPKKENAPKPAPTQDSKKANDDNKGKKRDRNGDVIAKEEKTSGKGKQSKPNGENENDALRQEILALGGTEEDLDLVAGVGSESETEDKADAPKKQSNKSNDDSLRKELSSMLAAAGQVVPDDLEDDEEEGEEEEADGGEEEEEKEEEEDGDDESDEQEDDAEQEVSDAEEEASPVPSAKATKESTKKEPVKSEDYVPKEYSKLVRESPSWMSTKDVEKLRLTIKL